MNERIKELAEQEILHKPFKLKLEMSDISCPTCGREILCGRVEDMCSTIPCGILERRKPNSS
jgi:NMD protein affecting ribosome stability and mRNA decay